MLLWLVLLLLLSEGLCSGSSSQIFCLYLLRFLKKQVILQMTEKGICDGSCLIMETVCAFGVWRCQLLLLPSSNWFIIVIDFYTFHRLLMHTHQQLNSSIYVLFLLVLLTLSPTKCLTNHFTSKISIVTHSSGPISGVLLCPYLAKRGEGRDLAMQLQYEATCSVLVSGRSLLQSTYNSQPVSCGWNVTVLIQST